MGETLSVEIWQVTQAKPNAKALTQSFQTLSLPLKLIWEILGEYEIATALKFLIQILNKCQNQNIMYNFFNEIRGNSI